MTKPKKNMSKALIRYRLGRAENLIALDKYYHEQNRLLFYWVAVNNAIQGLKKGKKK